MTTPRLLLATGNAHKVGELTAILSETVKGFSPSDLGKMSDYDVSEPVEDGATFSENALIKARALVAATGIASIADDSGICVTVMGGAPGIFSARWAGKHGDDDANLDLLLAQMNDTPDHLREASFQCAAALVLPDGTEIVEIGIMPGTLRRERAGSGGFGYDPIFEPSGYNVTAAELTSKQKNVISHRGHAFKALAPHIAAYLHTT